MPMWKVEQCMEMFFCSTGIYFLFDYTNLPFLLFNFLSGSNKMKIIYLKY